MTNLLLCPECGGKPKLSSLLPQHPDRKYFCNNSGTHGLGGDWKNTRQAAIKEWNKQVQEYKKHLKIAKMPAYKVDAEGSEAKHIIELLKAESEGRIIVSPVKIGDKVKVDARTLPYNYLHPADRCGDFANCKVIGFVKTKTRMYMKIAALYPSRMNRRGYLKYSMGAIGKTVFIAYKQDTVHIGLAGS